MYDVDDAFDILGDSVISCSLRLKLLTDGVDELDKDDADDDADDVV